MKQANRMKCGLGIILLTALTGCVGYVDGGYYGPAVVTGPDVFIGGGFYDRGRDVHAYSNRGHESRGYAHHDGGGGHEGGHDRH